MHEDEWTAVYLPVGNAHNAYRVLQIESDNGPLVNGPILPSKTRQILPTCHIPDVTSSSYAEVFSSTGSLLEWGEYVYPSSHHGQNDNILLVDRRSIFQSPSYRAL